MSPTAMPPPPPSHAPCHQWQQWQQGHYCHPLTCHITNNNNNNDTTATTTILSCAMSPMTMPPPWTTSPMMTPPPITSHQHNCPHHPHDHFNKHPPPQCHLPWLFGDHYPSTTNTATCGCSKPPPVQKMNSHLFDTPPMLNNKPPPIQQPTCIWKQTPALSKTHPLFH